MISSNSRPIHREPANYDEVSMQQSLIFSDSLKDLKNLKMQLYSAAEYFEMSCINADQKQIVVDTLKDYAIKALVNTVDHLGSVTYKVNDLLDEKVDEVSGTELRLSCIEQDHLETSGALWGGGRTLIMVCVLSQVGETIHVTTRTDSKYQGCSLDDEDDWHQFKNAVRATIIETPSVRKGPSSSPSPQPLQQAGTFLFSGNILKKEQEQRTVSPYRFPLLRSRSLASRPTTPNSRATTPNPSRPTTPNSFVGKPQYPSEHRISASMRLRPEKGKENSKELQQYPSKSKRLLKALLSRRKSKKDDMLYTYLDEY
ncbi:ABL interactor-like protein 3 [Actinidia rufa]|uniref:ABL interactor-like protein 3 n=1 Tax=Actinidia rufa TaxID=165716 RepID=A0A7J0ECK7_9ERIC|nr:ABL interactor-like protein 3 [Actinidia rufa]